MKVFKNYLLNALYQLLIIILPLITVPYITRIFTPEQIGVNAYTFSFSQYFVLFAALGVGIYGNRTIAYVKDNQDETIKTFWSIFFAILMTSIIAVISYFAIIFNFIRDNIIIYLIQSLYVVSVAIDISWLYMGMEDFKKIVTRNTIVKIIGVIGIFIFVKSENDLAIYIFILAMTHFLGYVSMWIYLPQYIKGFDFNFSRICSHFGPLIKIYIPQVAMQVYVIMDKTMIGVLSNDAQVGYYDMSQKIVKIILSLLTSLGVVMIPHISNLIRNKEYKEVEKSISTTIKYMSYFAFPMAFGLSSISRGLASWFFGIDYSYTGILMSFSAFIIIAITWSNILGMQLLMPMMKEKEFTLSVIGGAVVNIIINLCLIPYFGAFGAIIATIVAEFTVTFIQIILIKKYINVIPYLISTWKCFIAAISMYVVINICSQNFNFNFLTTIIQVFIGMLVYSLAMFILRSDIQQELFKQVKVMFLKFIH